MLTVTNDVTGMYLPWIQHRLLPTLVEVTHLTYYRINYPEWTELFSCVKQPGSLSLRYSFRLSNNSVYVLNIQRSTTIPQVFSSNKAWSTGVFWMQMHSWYNTVAFTLTGLIWCTLNESVIFPSEDREHTHLPGVLKDPHITAFDGF